jgi:cell division protein FtsZ
VAAAQQAINSPLLEDVTIQGAKGILMNITSGPNLRLHEVEEAASLIMEAAHEDCNIIFGAVVDPNMGETLRITVIATGFDQHEPEEEVLGNAIAAHVHRARRQSQQMQMPGIGSSVVGMGGAPQQGPQVFSGTLQRKAKSSSAKPASPRREPNPPPPSVNPMYASSSASQSQPRVPAPAAPAQESGLYTRNPGVSGGWSRGEAATTDPREVPAFLRRRGTESDDGGYVR